MIEAKLEGVDFLVVNTDGQALAASLATRKIQLDRQQTKGLGAGSKPEVGRLAAEASSMRSWPNSLIAIWCLSPPAWVAALAQGRARDCQSRP